ncbi:type VI secretion system baseplate subunit TssE [Hylemonella sp. W303a]|uniref:type VI secretion system baseplate subunit TssE n=1 Tax=Hylemonella sp. W303a TaxID=3389873 RepID=UPI00396B0558
MQYLFERLNAQGHGRARPTESGEQLREAVRSQIQWLVGSRDWRAEQEMRGLLDIALPALPTLGKGGSQLKRYVERLKQLIQRHEPRLTQVQVELQATGQSLTPFTVVVSGQLAANDADQNVRFEYEPGPRDVREVRATGS